MAGTALNRPLQALSNLVRQELDTYRAARSAGDQAAAWRALENAHILSQSNLALHLRTHIAMLGFAVALRDGREATGQAIRLALAPLGALTGRLPWGNSGRASVSAFRPMPVAGDLRAKLAAAGIRLPDPDGTREDIE